MKVLQRVKLNKEKKSCLIQDLMVYNYLKEGIRPSKICSILNTNKKTIQNHLYTLKKEGYIKKVGYGTWEILKEKEVLVKSSGHPKRSLGSVRSHGFMFILENPKPNIYENKRTRKVYENISNCTGKGKKLTLNGNKVHLWKKHTIFYIKKDFYNDNAIEGSVNATESLIETIRQLEGIFNISLKIRGSYRFKLLRQHHALINNEIAKDCNVRKEKIKVYAEDGKLSILIDNSLNLNELETVHPVDAVKDNNNMKSFIESARRNPNILDILSGSAMQQAKTLEETILAVHNLALVFEGFMALMKLNQPKEEQSEPEETGIKPYYVG